MDRSEWYPGRRVRIKPPRPILPQYLGGGSIEEGVITEVVLAKDGVLVRPDGLDGSFGWGFGELELLPLVVGPSIWERLLLLRKERSRERMHEAAREHVLASLKTLGQT